MILKDYNYFITKFINKRYSQINPCCWCATPIYVRRILHYHFCNIKRKSISLHPAVSTLFSQVIIRSMNHSLVINTHVHMNIWGRHANRLVPSSDYVVLTTSILSFPFLLRWSKSTKIEILIAKIQTVQNMLMKTHLVRMQGSTWWSPLAPFKHLF